MTIHPLPVNASDADHSAAVEENLFALFRVMATSLPEGELVETETLSYHHVFPSNPMFKGVWRTRLSDNEVDVVIDQTLDWFKAHNAPFIFWWVGPQTQPANLPEHLTAHGFMPNIIGDPGMAVNLHRLNEDIQTRDGFTIVHVDDQKVLEDWRDVFVATYEVPEWAGQAWVDATMRISAANAPWRLYVGYLNGKPVATNILFNGAGVAGVYGVGTLPEVRRQGIGAAIMLKPLIEARDQGYHMGVLFATEMGVPLYERLGYRELDCKLGRYLWINQS